MNMGIREGEERGEGEADGGEGEAARAGGGGRGSHNDTGGRQNGKIRDTGARQMGKSGETFETDETFEIKSLWGYPETKETGKGSLNVSIHLYILPLKII